MSVGYVHSSITCICLMVIVKTFNRFSKENSCVHAETSVVGSNVLVIHDHNDHVDMSMDMIVNLDIRILLLWMLL